MGRRKIITPNKCDNRGYHADHLETVVWEQIEKLLSSPEFLLSELERMRNEPGQGDLLESELSEANRRLRELNTEQEQLLQWALKGFPEEAVIRENERINQTRVNLKEHKAELEQKMEDAKECEVSLGNVEKFCELASENLTDFTYENKRFALDVLQVKVVIDGDKASIQGCVPIAEGDIVYTPAG